MINDSKGEWKIQITMKIVFVSLIDKIETQVMHTKSDNIEIMNGIDTSDVINELIDSFMKRYQEGLETKTKGSSYIICFIIKKRCLSIRIYRLLEKI